MAGDDEPEIGCSLSSEEARDQLGEWEALVADAHHVERSPSTLRVTLAKADAARVRDLAEREAACCAFLDITVEETADTVVVTVASPHPEADVVVELIGHPEV